MSCHIRKIIKESKRPRNTYIRGLFGKIMKKVKITVKRISCYSDLIEQYEEPIGSGCNMKLNQEFIANGWRKPDGFCDSAWEILSPFVMTLSHGGSNFFDGWMKNKKSAMVSCNDGFRPVSFYLEALEEDADSLI